jgi:hypothetical protein
MEIVVKDIVWDAPNNIGLPNEVVLGEFEWDAEYIADSLTDYFGYCVCGFNVEVA